MFTLHHADLVVAADGALFETDVVYGEEFIHWSGLKIKIARAGGRGPVQIEPYGLDRGRNESFQA